MNIKFLFQLLFVLSVSSCGGGGGGGGSASENNIVVPPPTVLANSVKMVVDGGPAGRSVNQPFVSVTVCEPGGNGNCQTIDHVLVDTGSSGLRIFNSLLGSSLTSALPNQVVGNSPVGQCAKFVSGYLWGSLKLADVRLGDFVAPRIPIQLISDPALGSIPSGCSSGGSNMGSVSALGANGILGVGLSQQFCGSYCGNFSSANIYFQCPAALTCQSTALPVAQQDSNPVFSFASDNNGVLLQLPSISSSGASAAAGTLYFGIATRSNNALGAASAFFTDSQGFISTVYNGVSNSNSYIDSGSNGFFIPDASITSCFSGGASGWFCPLSSLNLTAQIKSIGSSNSANISFNIDNSQSLFNTTNKAFANLGAYQANAFTWGLPFFYGKNVFIGFEGRTNPAGTGPMYLF
ncbi:DUF3443 domain-containing protein [Neisseriaceae bacterium TC5R-5]|nr:DUF3443 domain-containing protein [Neisseriaceae bacterium TC5R-5]